MTKAFLIVSALTPFPSSILNETRFETTTFMYEFPIMILSSLTFAQIELVHQMQLTMTVV